MAENSGGPHTLKYGVTTNHVLALEVVLPDGNIVELGSAAPDAPGYDLVSAFVGCEGTFGIATKILVRLTPIPEGVRTVLAIFDRVGDACRAVSEILGRGITPAAIELIDQTTLRAVEAYIHAGFPLDAAAVLLVEVDGLADELDEQARAVLEGCRAAGVRDVRLARDEAERLLLWKGRKQAFGALGRLAPNYYTHDGVIPRTKLPEVLQELERIAERTQVTIANVFHAGDGNLHPVVLYDEREPGVLDRVRAAGDGILRLVLAVGGALSGEHGIGLEKIGYMAQLYSEADLAAMRRLRDSSIRGICATRARSSRRPAAVSSPARARAASCHWDTDAQHAQLCACFARGRGRAGPRFGSRAGRAGARGAVPAARRWPVKATAANAIMGRRCWTGRDGCRCAGWIASPPTIRATWWSAFRPAPAWSTCSARWPNTASGCPSIHRTPPPPSAASWPPPARGRAAWATAPSRMPCWGCAWWAREARSRSRVAAWSRTSAASICTGCRWAPSARSASCSRPTSR